MITFSQLSRYQKIYYSIINTIATEHNNIYSNNPDQSISRDIPLPTNNEMFEHFGNSHSKDFFIKDSTNIVSGVGRKSLIVKTIGIRTNITLLDNENVEIMFILSQLVNILSRNKNEILVSVLNNVIGCTRKQYQKKLQSSREYNRTITISIKSPIIYFELRSFFKKKSLFTNFSYSQVLVLRDHVYCRSIEYVTDFIAYSTKKYHKTQKEYIVESLLKSHYGKNQV